MKVFATITSKGQITVPLAVRKDLGLKPGDRVSFESLAGGAFSLRPVSRHLDGLIGCLADYALKAPVGEAEIEQARAAEFSEGGT